MDHMGANFEFLQIADASKHFTGINNVETVVTAQRHNHPGGAYSYRIERNGKVLVAFARMSSMASRSADR